MANGTLRVLLLSPTSPGLNAVALAICSLAAFTACQEMTGPPDTTRSVDDAPAVQPAVAVPGLLDGLRAELAALADAELGDKEVRKLIRRLDMAGRVWQRGDGEKAARELLKLDRELHELIWKGKLRNEAGVPVLGALAQALVGVFSELGWAREAEAVIQVRAEAESLLNDGLLEAEDARKLHHRVQKALEKLAKGDPEKAARELDKLLRVVDKKIEGDELSAKAATELRDAALRAIALLRGELPPVFTGLPGDPVETAVQDLVFTPRPEDYSTGHPEVPGVTVSFNTLALVFAAGVTIGEANELLGDIRAELVGSIAGPPGVLILRVPTDGHQEMEELLADLRVDPRVSTAVQDMLVEPGVLPADNGGSPAGWTWENTPGGGNWGFELARVPQMWNLNPAIEKAGRSPTTIGVIDVGFETSHPDLSYATNLDPGDEDDHGTHVAGIIGAGFDNGTGVDGVDPFSRLIVAAPSTWAEDLQRVKTLSLVHDARVLNTSLGFNWGRKGIHADVTPWAQGAARKWGRITTGVLDGLEVLGKTPLWLTSAGNNSDDGLGVQTAIYSSPYTNAALEQGASGILAVEAVGLSAGSPGDAARADFSNVQGHLSAPGVDILSTSTGPGLYAVMSGTSMATPFVAGLAGYLLSLEPSLTRDQLRQLLLENTIPVGGGASPRVDAFAAALAIDQLPGITGSPVRRMLLDIDDGTPDGNRRVNIDGTANVSEDADGDGGAGDGVVDMADFRRYRDWLVQVVMPGLTDLDGAPDHPKKDVNGDGTVGSVADESVHPRGDFNGDGQLAIHDRAPVPGLGRVSDLSVLRSEFQDPHYAPEDLPKLVVSSFDLEVNAAACLQVPDAVAARSAVGPVEEVVGAAERRHTPVGAVEIYTLPSFAPIPEYTARLEALDSGGGVLGSVEETFVPLLPGADVRWAPERCEACSLLTAGLIASSGTSFHPVIVPSAPASVEPGQWELNNARAFPERRGVVLEADLPVDGTVDPASRLRINQNNPPPGGIIPAGTVVNSYLIQVDPVDNSFTDAFGTVYLDETVLGTQVLSSTLDAGDAVLGSSTTAYPTGLATRGKELHGSILRFGLFFSPAPQITLSNIVRQGWPAGAVSGVSFNTVVPSPNVGSEELDQMRIITLADCGGGG